MSAYFVTDDTIHRVVTLCQINFWTEAFQDPTTFGKRLMRMNADALHARYEDAAEHWSEIPLAIKNYVFQRDRQTPAQMAKSLDCLLYQSAEGNVPETDLFKRLSAMRDALNGTFGDDEYGAAEWA